MSSDPDDSPSDLPPSERIKDHARILRALQQAVREALARHKLEGNPVAIWRDGRVVWIPPEEIPVSPPPKSDNSGSE